MSDTRSSLEISFESIRDKLDASERREVELREAVRELRGGLHHSRACNDVLFPDTSIGCDCGVTVLLASTAHLVEPEASERVECPEHWREVPGVITGHPINCKGGCHGTGTVEREEVEA